MPEFTKSDVAVIKRRSVLARREFDTTEQCDALNAFRQPGSRISTAAAMWRGSMAWPQLSQPRSEVVRYGRSSGAQRLCQPETWMAFAITSFRNSFSAPCSNGQSGHP